MRAYYTWQANISTIRTTKTILIQKMFIKYIYISANNSKNEESDEHKLHL